MKNIISFSYHEDDDGDLNIEVVTIKARLGLSFGKDNYCYYVERGSDNSIAADIPDDLLNLIAEKIKP